MPSADQGSPWLAVQQRRSPWGAPSGDTGAPASDATTWETPNGRAVPTGGTLADMPQGLSTQDRQRWLQAHPMNSPGSVDPMRRAQAAATGKPGVQYGTGAYDPTNPNAQYNADGTADLGASNGNNDANAWNSWQTEMLGGQKRQKTMEGQIAGDRSAEDQLFANRPQYEDYIAPPSYQAPTYTDPAAFKDTRTAPGAFVDTRTAPTPGARAPLLGVDDAASAFGRVRAATGIGNTPVQQTVGGGGAAFQQYAQGALAQLQQRLSLSSRGITDSAASKGRLDTGFYDEDQGANQRTLAGESRADLLAKALDAAKLDQDAATGNADRAAAAGTAAGSQSASLFSTIMGAQGDENTLGQRDYDTDTAAARDAYEKDRSFDYGANQDAVAQYDKDRSFDYGAYQDQVTAGRKNFESDRTFGEGQHEFDANLGFDVNKANNAGRQGAYSTAYDELAGRYRQDTDQGNIETDRNLDMNSSWQDRLTANKNYQDSQSVWNKYLLPILGGGTKVATAAVTK